MSPSLARQAVQQRTKRALAAALSVLLLVQAIGCTSWRSVPQPWPETVARHPNRRARLVLREGQSIKVDSVRVISDTLIAFRGQTADTTQFWQVDAILIRQFDSIKALWVVVYVSAFAAAVVGVAVGYALIVGLDRL